MKYPAINIGDKFGKWTVLKDLGFPKKEHTYLCVCDCGKQSKILGSALKRKRSMGCCSCNERRFKHGLSKTKLYMIWAMMKQRCYNEKVIYYKYYGGRGITICDRWLNSFENFLSDMGERPSELYSIDRINNDGNYEPNNCRWATPKEQGQNRRRKAS